MDKKRRDRYGQKCKFILEKLNEVFLNPKDDTHLYASLYCMQVSIEAATDLAAMLVKDLGLDVGDDYHNVDLLQRKGIIPSKIAEELRGANGLRNAIVHRYNSFEQELAFKRIPSIKKAIESFIELVDVEVNELTKSKS